VIKLVGIDEEARRAGAANEEAAIAYRVVRHGGPLDRGP
jgi:hypothetical protein